jgi:exonuclease SbcC
MLAEIEIEEAFDYSSVIENMLAEISSKISLLKAKVADEEKRAARKALLKSKLIPEAKNKFDTAERETVKAGEELLVARATLEQAEKLCISLKEKLKFSSRAEAEKKKKELESEARSLSESIEKASLAYANCDKAISELSAASAQLEKQLSEHGDIDEETLLLKKAEISQKKVSLLSIQKEAHARISQNKAALSGIVSNMADLAAVQTKWTWIKALSNTANGNISGKEKIMLETYIQTTFFDRILNRANIRLLVMSGGQYELKRRRNADNQKSQSGLEIDVIDHYNGTERSVRTLSGGESFKASLSLALGLSDEIQSSAGGIHLDTLFVDEGFGSLDEESLQQAIKALVSLADGNRLVGIISHVSELKSRIDKQIVVKKEKSGGSSVKIVL